MDIDSLQRQRRLGNQEEIDLSEETVTGKIEFVGKVVTLETQTVRLVDGTLSERELVRHSGGACVVPVDENGNVYLIRQYRKVLELETLELPAGKLEEDENPYYCAVRELKEETGFEAERIEPLGELFPTPGYSDEVIHIYLATGLRSGKQELDPGEFLKVVSLPFADVLDAIFDGRIRDAKTVVGILKAKEILELE